MSSTYYTSLSGMMAASYGLQNTSNNVANMQSPGFKRNDVFYSSLGHGNGEDSLGSGVCIAGHATNFKEGNYLETQNPSDLAIVGQGFFVVRLKNGELLYTRDGEFGFNNEGILTDRHSGGQVQGYDHAGNLVPIHEKGPKTCAGKASQHMYIKGQLALIKEDKEEPGPIKNPYKNIQFEVKEVYDSRGKAHQITFELQCAPDVFDEGKSWELIGVTCDDAEITFSTGQKIVFSSFGGAANPDQCSIKFSINHEASVHLNFGNYYDGADQSVELKESKAGTEPVNTEITVLQNDGYGEGKPIRFSFDENGQISYHYDNGQSIEGIYIGLARFDDMEHHLIQTQNNLFRAKTGSGIHLGRANHNGFGSIQSKQLESSNVDSTTEFANIVILQRMFQACSQIMNIDKQLIEELQNP